MILLFSLYFLNIILIQSKSYEIPRTISNDFLKSKISFRNKYEEARETMETKRESCLDEYQQHEKSNQRRHLLSSYCTQYCAETMNCQPNNGQLEQSACINPLWPSRMMRYVQKFERICYIRITEVIPYERAEQICRRYGLQLAIIDNIRLLERLKQLNMFNITCKGQCPKARGYYIGLKRLINNNNNQSESKWIWSNNITWIQNETNCDEYSHTSYANASLLCYIDHDGEKKVTVWNKNEPNNYQADEQCVEIIANTDNQSSLEQIGKLNDIPCTKPTLGVICQMKDIKPINSTRFEYFAKIAGFNQTKIIEQNLDEMTEVLEGLLILPSFTTEQAVNVLNVVDQLVNITGKLIVKDKSVTNKLLQFLDQFPAKLDTGNISFQYENINISITDINVEQETHEWFTIKSNQENSNTIIEINIQSLQTQLTQSNTCRIIETTFSNFNLFPQINITSIGIPISYQIANLTTIKTDEDLIRFQIRVSKQVIQSHNLSCVYWSFDDNNGSWVSDNGCRFMGYINDYAQCYCNHLTHFALLMLSEVEETLELLSGVEEFILTFVTYIGICLSIFGLFITLITYLLFGRKKRNHLHASLIMLCLSIFLVNCLYVPFSFTHIKRKIYCSILGFLIHYFFLTSFIWMLIMAIVQYMHFVRVFDSHISHFFIKTCAIGWIIPLIFPSAVILFGSNGGYTGEVRCWINNQILLYLTFLIPISIIIICNLILFGFILKSIFRHDEKVVTYQKNRSKLQMGAALCCFVSIGCTWLFGIIVLIEPSFIYQLIFCICNSFQGFFIFLFHVYLSKPKRELWQTFFIEHKLHKRPDVSLAQTDTMTVSSSSGGIAARPGKLRFSTTSSSYDQQESITRNNSTSIDRKGNELLKSTRLSHGAIRLQQSLSIEQKK